MSSNPRQRTLQPFGLNKGEPLALCEDAKVLAAHRAAALPRQHDALPVVHGKSLAEPGTWWPGGPWRATVMLSCPLPPGALAGDFEFTPNPLTPDPSPRKRGEGRTFRGGQLV
jgi:hypothetical protein